MNVYLDNASTTPLSRLTKDYIYNILDIWGNPSSKHSLGLNSNIFLENVRKTVSKFINGKSGDVIFTSGGSASNTLAIREYPIANECELFYSPILHKSALLSSRDYWNSYPLLIKENGLLNIDYLEEQLSRAKAPFVVLEYANSEIGTLYDIKKITEIVHKYNGVVYLDCTGSISQIPLDVKNLDVDMCGFSAHKIGGLKGCGVLYKKKNIKIDPLIFGTQEGGLFGGTENIVGIASLGKAISQMDYKNISSSGRDYIYNELTKHISDCYVIGTMEYRLPHNLFMCFKGVYAPSLVTLLDEAGIQVSTGSACNNGSSDPPNTLLAIGTPTDDLNSCIRITLSGNETKEQLIYACNKIIECVSVLRYFS